MKNYIKICGVEQTTLLLCFCIPVSKTGTGVELIEKKTFELELKLLKRINSQDSRV
jgi:hypothetical protein